MSTCDISMCTNRPVTSEEDDDGNVQLLCEMHSAPDSIRKP